MTATCTSCGAPLVPDARFCAQCGTPVPAAGDAGEAGDAGGYEEYYPEDFPDHRGVDADRQVLAGTSYPTEPPSAYGVPAYSEPGYGGPAYSEPGYGGPDYGGPDYAGGPDEPAYAAGGFAEREEGLGSPWQEPDGGRSRALLIGGAVLVGLLVLIGLVYFLLFRPSSSPTASLPSSAPSASARATSPPPAPVTTPPRVTPPPSPSQPAYPAVTLPAGSTVCPAVATGAYAHVAAGNTSTSCEFAAAVRAAYEPVAAPGTSVLVQATSPRTGKTYSMTCSGTQPVFCTGGNNAQVILFGGTPTAP